MTDAKPTPETAPEPLPPAEHEKALRQEEERQANLRGGPHPVHTEELPKVHGSDD